MRSSSPARFAWRSPFRRWLVPHTVASLALLAPVGATTAARVTINSNSGSLSSSSTNSTGSFQIENLSSGGVKITSVTIDTETALLPDVVFDPAGTAGDPDGKAFQLDSFSGTGTPTHGFESPQNGSNSADGYRVIRITCGSGVDFGPGDTLTFSADVDPTSVKGAPGPGPEHSASISGLELIGATVTVVFSDGTTRVARTGGLPGSSANKASMAQLAPDNLATPTIAVPGKVSPFTIATQPSIRVTGPAGAAVKLWSFKTGLFLAGVPGGGYDIDPYEVNKVTGYGTNDATIGAGGTVDIPVTLSTETGGINMFSAVLQDGAGRRSSSSNILAILYNPSGGGADTVPPSVPSGFAVSGVTATSVALTWTASTDNTGVAGYKVYRDGAVIATTTQTDFTDLGRAPSTAYLYEVEAFDAAGNDSPHALVGATTAADLQPPTTPGNLLATAGQNRVELSWSAATDNAGVKEYRVLRDSVEIAVAVGTGHLDTGLAGGTEYDYQVIAVDFAGNESAPAAVSATPLALMIAPFRVNVGSASSYTDPQGNTWLADFGYNTGYTEQYGTAILGTDKAPLYQSRRIDRSSGDELNYAFAMADGRYQVVLHLVEVWSGGFAPGIRVFDVTAEGALVADDVDIFALGGANGACVVSFPVNVDDGELDIGFLHQIQNPTLSGIEVLPLAPTPDFGEWLGARGLGGMVTADSDGGGLDNFNEYQLQLDPNDEADDLAFRLGCQKTLSGAVLSLPALLPLGNYHLHRSADLATLSDPVNRISTFTKARIVAMSPAQRASRVMTDASGGGRAFYQLFFEPVAD
jgi:chitodextrinase